MPPDDKLSAAEVATRTRRSVPTIYRLLKDDANFPAPIKEGRKSYWLTTAVDKWLADRHELPVTNNLDSALPPDANVDRHTPPAPLNAALLAGLTQTQIASEMNLSDSTVSRWIAEKHVPPRHLPELRRIACTAILHREKELRDRLEGNPQLQQDEYIRFAALDLDVAHRLMFGRSLLEHLSDQQQEDSDNVEH